MNKKGLSLLEIVVALMILAVVMTGLGAVFVGGKRFITYNRGKMMAAEGARTRGAGFHGDVREDLYDHAVKDYVAADERLQLVTDRPDNIDYLVDPDVSQELISTVTTNTRPPGAAADTQMRKVEINMRWDLE